MGSSPFSLSQILNEAVKSKINNSPILHLSRVPRAPLPSSTKLQFPLSEVLGNPSPSLLPWAYSMSGTEEISPFKETSPRDTLLPNQ